MVPHDPTRSRVLVPASLLLLGLASGLGAQQTARDWPQWRGPDRDGISKETGWSVKGKPEPVWKAEVGMGYSTVSIEDGRLLTMGHDKAKQQDTIWCLDSKTGKELWKHTFPSKTWDMAHKGGTLSTPSFAGKHVFASNREGNFFCFDTATGKLLWHKQLKEEHDLKYPTWGLSTSPLVLGETVIMNVGPVLAFDHRGKLLWKTERSYGHAYSTPVDFEFDEKPALLVFDGDGLVVLDREQGKELQIFPWTTPNHVNAASPVLVDGGRVFVSSGYNRGCGMIQLDKLGPKLLWENKAMCNHMTGCCLFEGHLYGMDEGTLKCLDLDGNEKWAQKLGKGCMSMADGKILAMSAQGELVVAAATPAGFQQLSRSKVLSGGVYWTTPVLVGGFVYCRNSEGKLVCLDHRSKAD